MFTTKTTSHNKKIKILKWWRQLEIPIIKKKKNNNSSYKSATSSHTTLDWRSLSPDRPPLPFFLPDTASIVQPDTTNNRSIHNNTTTTTTNPVTIITPIENNNINNKIERTPTITTTTTSTNNTKSTRSNTTTDERNYQPLCPILEESETMVTDSSVSNNNVIHSNSRISPSIMHEEEHTSDSSSIKRNAEKQPMSKSSDTDEEDTQSVSSFHPPPTTTDIQKTPSDKYMSDEYIGDEERCKRKFAKMVLAANKFKTKQEKDSRPSHMALLFDVEGNIDMMRMVRQGKSEYHKFCGNSQYVPPELSINIEYNSDLADIWVLGIFLYRMLVGKYPFSAENDQQLFKKMLRGNFSIPPELSEDAKDLLRRMLAPDMTRASLDLVIYHPWIKSYRPLLLDQYHTTSKATSSLTPKNEYFTNTTPQQQRNTTIRRSNSVHATTPPQDQTKIEPIPKPRKKSSSRFIKKAFLLLLQGPFPPPKKPYRDLSHLGTRDSVFARQQQKV